MQSILDIICKVYYTEFAKLTLQKRRRFFEIEDCAASKTASDLTRRVGNAVGVTRQTITSLEVEKYTASLILAYKIAKYFGMTIEEVFDFSEMEDSNGKL